VKVLDHVSRAPSSVAEIADRPSSIVGVASQSSGLPAATRGPPAVRFRRLAAAAVVAVKGSLGPRSSAGRCCGSCHIARHYAKRRRPTRSAIRECRREQESLSEEEPASPGDSGESVTFSENALHFPQLFFTPLFLSLLFSSFISLNF
jgi:hypothetical protein